MIAAIKRDLGVVITLVSPPRNETFQPSPTFLDDRTWRGAGLLSQSFSSWGYISSHFQPALWTQQICINTFNCKTLCLWTWINEKPLFYLTKRRNPNVRSKQSHWKVRERMTWQSRSVGVKVIFSCGGSRMQLLQIYLVFIVFSKSYNQVFFVIWRLNFW